MKAKHVAAMFCVFTAAAQGSEPSVTVLPPCPDKPNCVSTADPKAQHGIAPLPFRGTAQQTRDTLVQLLASMPHSAIVKAQDQYLHATFTSRVFGFVDDIEFLLDEKNQQVHMRSASRSGYYDFGVNKIRLKEVAAKWPSS